MPTSTYPFIDADFYKDRVIFSEQVTTEPVALLASIEGIGSRNSTYVFISKEAVAPRDNTFEDARPQANVYHIYVGENKVLRALPVIDFAIRHTDTGDELNLVLSLGTIYLPPASSRHSPYFLYKKMYHAMDEFSFVERPGFNVTLSSSTNK